jgi:hypothetical protein
MTPTEVRQEEIDARYTELMKTRDQWLEAIAKVETCDNTTMANFLKALDQSKMLTNNDRWSGDDLITVAGDPEIRRRLVDRLKEEIARMDEEVIALIEETLRLYPEDFTKLPGGSWGFNAHFTKH